MSESEGITATAPAEISADSWVHEQEGLSDEDKQTLSKYKSSDEVIKGAANAQRMLGKAVNWPDDNTSGEDREAFNGKINAYQKIPDKPDGYEIDRTGIPDTIQYDEDMEKMLREAAHGSKAKQSVVSAVMAGYTKMMLERHGAMEKLAKESEQGLKDDPDFDFDVKIGKEGGAPGTIKAGLIQLSEQLKMDYKDENGDPQSHLIDALEFIRPNGAIGNMAPLVKAMDYLLNYRYAEGRTDTGDPVAAAKTGGEFGTSEFYDKVDIGGGE